MSDTVLLEQEHALSNGGASTSSSSSSRPSKFQTLTNFAKSTDAFPAWPFYMIYLVPLVFFYGAFTDGGLWYYSPLFIAFGIVPLCDLTLPTLKLNPTPEQEKILEKQFKFQLPIWLWVPTQIFSVLAATHIFSTWDLTLFERVGIVLSMGLLGGQSINVAHELGHKISKTEKFLAKTSLAFVCYMHFQIEHIMGHHWNVATPKDPATSRLGESLYEFIPRSVFYSLTSAWEIESKRLEKEKKEKWSSDNQMLWYIFWPIVISACIGAVWGWMGLGFFFLQAAIGFSFLEIINYVEHYGLLREEISPGHYEPVRPIHSWNANESVSNYFLFKLQRHSDHHTFPVRRYQVLRSFEESPQLPTGYAGCVMLSLIPPLWKAVMDPRVITARKMVEEYRKSN